jgi:hypothetical protein
LPNIRSPSEGRRAQRQAHAQEGAHRLHFGSPISKSEAPWHYANDRVRVAIGRVRTPVPGKLGAFSDMRNLKHTFLSSESMFIARIECLASTCRLSALGQHHNATRSPSDNASIVLHGTHHAKRLVTLWFMSYYGCRAILGPRRGWSEW